MTEDVRAEDSSSSPLADGVLPLPLEFEAHYVTHQQAFHHYALFHLGSNDAAEEAVHRTFLEILRHWNALLAEPNLQQQTWAIMRRVVISQSLRGFRRELAQIGTGGLYLALSTLPPRQFDVIVLRYLNNYSTQQISWYMGITDSTVDYHCRKAKERLRVVLDLPSTKDTEKNKKRNRK